VKTSSAVLRIAQQIGTLTAAHGFVRAATDARRGELKGRAFLIGGARDAAGAAIWTPEQTGLATITRVLVAVVPARPARVRTCPRATRELEVFAPVGGRIGGLAHGPARTAVRRAGLDVDAARTRTVRRPGGTAALPLDARLSRAVWKATALGSARAAVVGIRQDVGLAAVVDQAVAVSRILGLVPEVQDALADELAFALNALGDHPAFAEDVARTGVSALTAVLVVGQQIGSALVSDLTVGRARCVWERAVGSDAEERGRARLRRAAVRPRLGRRHERRGYARVAVGGESIFNPRGHRLCAGRRPDDDEQYARRDRTDVRSTPICIFHVYIQIS